MALGAALQGPFVLGPGLGLGFGIYRMRNEGSIRVQRGSLQIQHSSGLERSEQPQRFLNATRRVEERNVRPTFSLLSCLQPLLMLEGLQFKPQNGMQCPLSTTYMLQVLCTEKHSNCSISCLESRPLQGFSGQTEASLRLRL